MRTNIEIDDDLLAEAMAAAGLATKTAVVEEALRTLVRQSRRRAAIADMRGLSCQGDLDELREGRSDDIRYFSRPTENTTCLRSG
jgi:Arc/MetJ family transcription regulator